jgi:hypothetical protein
MPLMPGKSKKAFSKNVEIEMHAGKPQKQALAIAYSVKRKAPKKKASGGSVQSGSKDMNMAEGGMINAKNERRPMPDNRYDDAKMISQNSGKKAPKDDSWTDRPTERQAVSNNGRRVMPIKRPKMVPTNAFSTRMYDEEANLQESARPGPYGEQPPERDNEERPNRQGPKVSDMQDEHSTHRKPYAKGGMIDEMRHKSKHDMEPADHDIQEEEREDEAHLMSMESPSEDEGSRDAHRRNEERPDRQGPKVSDMEDEHSTGRKPYAGGGRIGDDEANEDHEMELNPAHDKHSPDDSEEMSDDSVIEHAASIAAAIMAKRDRKAMQHSDSDIDHEMMMAEGGEINEHDDAADIHSKHSIDSDSHSSQVDLSRNADEDANEEDQLSYNALRKENYSETPGLDALDSPMNSAQHGDDEESESENKHDNKLVSAIRRKMKSKSPISR